MSPLLEWGLRLTLCVTLPGVVGFIIGWATCYRSYVTGDKR